MPWSQHFLVIILFFTFHHVYAHHEIYTENLHIRSLPNGDLQSIFNYTVIGHQQNNNTVHSSIYLPWIFRDLLARFSIEQFHLSMAQGFWRTNLWGHQQLGTEVPSGTELIVKFGKEAKNSAQLWSDLVHTINGLFCTSILGMFPQFSGQPKLFGNSWWYGSLGGESVCTENLKSWKKLLPCKKNGLVALMEPTVLLSARFHSISLSVKKAKVSDEFHKLEFSLLAKTVHDGQRFLRDYRDLSFQNLFGQKLIGKCPVADHAEIVVAKNDQFSIVRSSPKPTSTEPGFALFDLKEWNEEEEDFNIHFVHNNQQDEQFKAAISLHTFVKSVDQIGGRICTRIANQYPFPINGNFMHMIPWQIRIFLHTLALSCSADGQRLPIKGNLKYTLARDRARPLLVELPILLPANANCKIEMDYEAAFLKIGDFPPDAGSGIPIPGPILSIPSATNDQLMSYLHKESAISSPYKVPTNVSHRVFGEPLLILLPVPDFSMPFNVICLVCTTIAIYYGNAFALSTKLMKLVPKEEKKEGDEERPKTILEKVKAKMAQCLDGLRRRLPGGNKNKRE